MKFLPLYLLLMGFVLPATGQDEANGPGVASREKAVSEWEVEIPNPIDDGTPPEPAVEPAPIDFQVISSRTEQRNVVEASEMPDLPPVTGRINVTMRLVENPNLPDPPEPLQALESDDPAVVARLVELRETYQDTSLVFISASVYDHRRTLLRIGTISETGGEVRAWSNIDFNHFSGFSTYRVEDAVDGTLHEYGILMGLGNEATHPSTEIDAPGDMEHEVPQIPVLPDVEDGGPAFVVMEGDPDSPAMATLEQIHDLYRTDGKRMAAAFHTREQARAERKAHLLANPPTPEDVTISFWKRGNPRAAGLKTLGTEGRR